MFLPGFPDAKSNKTSDKNITKASINTLTRYAHACSIKKPVIALY
jgi:hypothetical protein